MCIAFILGKSLLIMRLGYLTRINPLERKSLILWEFSVSGERANPQGHVWDFLLALSHVFLLWFTIFYCCGNLLCSCVFSTDVCGTWMCIAYDNVFAKLAHAVWFCLIQVLQVMRPAMAQTTLCYTISCGHWILWLLWFLTWSFCRVWFLKTNRRACCLACGLSTWTVM